jgi:translocation and assembly module TamA
VLAYVDIDDLDCDATTANVQRTLDRAVEQTHNALNAFGFYTPEVTTRLELDEDCWQATIAIVAGEPVRLRTVDIAIAGAAAGHPDFRTLQVSTPLVTGGPLRHGEYDSFKRSLQDLARNRGFAEARYEESRLDIYPEELAADVTLHFESGPRYAFGEVTVEQDDLADEFVDAYHEVTPGTPYDNRLLTSAFLDLNNSGYFSSVDVRPLPANPEALTIPVEIALTPAPRRIISYGVGYSTDTGPRLRFGRSIRRFNERGHRLMIDGQLSPVVSELTTTYRMPFGDPRYDWISYSLGAKRQETNTALSRSIEAGVRRVVDRARGWSQTQFLSYVVEDFKVGTQTGRPHLLIPGVDWTRIRGDDALRPTNGSKLSFDVRAADDQVLSDTSFVQTLVSTKWIHSFAGGGRVLLRARAGYMVEDDFEKLPPSVRFFAGGDQSVRGFDFESLGPVDANGAVVGGNRLIELSAEYERAIRPRWSLAVFSDAGNAFNEGFPEFRRGAGIGARWRSPLGPVRIDLAWPINDVESGARLHVSLGPDF